MRPPRALWVSFAFGRPFGVPDDAPFQTEVLRSALALLERTNEPVLEDYARDVPADAEPGAWACPVQLRTPEPATEADAAAQRLLDEVRLLRPWHDEFMRARGRTAVGVSGKSAEDVEAMAELVARFAAGEEGVAKGYAFDPPLVFKYVADDLRAFYYEAAAASPGRTPEARKLDDWLFDETQLGATLYRLAERVGPLRGAIIPGAYARRDA